MKFRSIVILFLFVSGCAHGPSKIDVQEAFRLIEEGKVLLIDVRTPEEYDAGHLPRAQLIPISQWTTQKRKLPLEKDKVLLVYCTVGVRSRRAAKLLKQMGYTDVLDLKGGIRSWKRAGLETVKP